MFCVKCGKELPEKAKFCPGCGAPVKRPTAPAEPGLQPGAEEDAPVREEPAAAEEPPAGEAAPPEEAGPDGPVPPVEEGPKRPGKKRRKGPILAVVLLLLAAVGGFLGFRAVQNHRAYQEQMELGARCAARGDYDAAAEKYQAALEHRPGDREAGMALADLLLRTEDFEGAAQLLDDLKPREGDKGKERWALLRRAAALAPQLKEIQTDDFPVIQLHFSCGVDEKLPELKVLENGALRPITESRRGEGTLTISYETEDGGYDAQRREIETEFRIGDYTFTRSGAYETPQFDRLRVELASVDMSSYPTVKAYLRVENYDSGENIRDLRTEDFHITERIEGGEYLAREVRSAAPLKDREGLSVDLVADKSSSIQAESMAAIQQVMTQFVGRLNLEGGDRAEVLAFDSIVQQMCCYTQAKEQLLNGIRSMAPDGSTALYDALYMGVENAALQGGARCVIAFTDGADNVSTHTAEAVIELSRQRRVPIYLIGVGSDVEEQQLKRIAEATGGRYWFIDDLYDLEEIYRHIYTRQQELYVVEYESDLGQDAYQKRELEVNVSGEDCRGNVREEFQPVRTVQGQSHPDRYELIKENLSWEEASRRCQEMGGHLATITTQEEMDRVTTLAEAGGVRFLWLGGYTSYDLNGTPFGHWVTGEPFGFCRWDEGEPSRVDRDGTPEWYIMLWDVKGAGTWSWNDQRNDPAATVQRMAPYMGFVCEYES